MTYPALFALWSAQGLAACLWLAVLPSDAGGFSLERWFLLGLTLFLSALSALAWFRSRTWTLPPRSLPAVIENSLYLLALGAALSAPLTILILRALGSTTYAYSAYAARLTPLAAWFTLAGCQWLWFHNRSQGLPHPTPRARRAFLVIVAGLVLLASLVFATGWGLTPTHDGSFGNPASPLMEWQIALGLILALWAAYQLPRLPQKRLDLTLFALVYGLTCLLWLADPLIPGYFATPPRAPNFEPYPFSDALIYAQYAQQALVGEGLLWPDVPTRPLYVSLLVWMHALAGQDYHHVISLQTLWLACFPACLYLLGKELGSRPLGLLLAALAALRDVTANHAAPFTLNYTYSKLYFSEVPTALGLVIFTILALGWMKASKPGWYTLLMGGVLGMAALIRLQSAVLLPILALISLSPLWKARRAEWLRGLIGVTLGLGLALSPWLARNAYATGGLVLDNPISQSMVLAWRWGGMDDSQIIPQQPDESAAQFTSRMTRLALENFRAQPGAILSSATNHFFNTLISSLEVFPARDGLQTPDELIWPTRAFWQSGQHSLPFTTLYLLLFALGLSAAWAALGWVGCLPLAFSLGYHAWTALFLSSGDRFLVPIDWTTYLYQAWGLLLLGQAALTGLRGNPAARQPVPDNGRKTPRRVSLPTWGQVALTAAIILLAGGSVPLSEWVFPQRYSAPAHCESLAQPGEVCVQGRAIYPRYYAAGEGEPGTAKMGYQVSAEARLVFWLAGPQPGLVILPLEAAPLAFPHAADVTILGRQEGETLRARQVWVAK